jgi:hypothetical protein
VEIANHQEMAILLWINYKERMGHSDGINMQFNLSSLLTVVEGLEDLTLPFSKKEMVDVINYMPSDKAPGPDGFNGLFVKKCWPILQSEFHRLASDFHQGNLDLQSIKGSYITLIPKKSVPEEVNDFRPISLTNVCLNFLTKLPSNRLQGSILDCINKNQYGFLRNRSIQDCLA